MISNAAFAQLMQQINLPSAAAEYDRFALYCTQLQEWNQRMNLTAITDDEGVAEKHFADSLLPLTMVQLPVGASLVDVGSGAGFPGLPLRERGIAAAPLRSQYKDWNADLKALHGLPAEPAEEHPQLLAADPICQRIGAAVSSGVAKPEQAEQKLPILLQDYKNHLHQGRFDRAMDAMELAAAMALSSALREFRQMGKVVSPQQGAERLRQSIQPHHNRGSLKNRADEIAMELQRILAQKASAGICGRESKESLAYRWLELAASCAKVPIRYEADQIKQRQKEEQAQRGAGPVME